MVGISSNIWGTKFKIHGLDTMLPAVIGQVKEFNSNDYLVQSPVWHLEHK